MSYVKHWKDPSSIPGTRDQKSQFEKHGEGSRWKCTIRQFSLSQFLSLAVIVYPPLRLHCFMHLFFAVNGTWDEGVDKHPLSLEVQNSNKHVVQDLIGRRGFWCPAKGWTGLKQGAAPEWVLQSMKAEKKKKHLNTPKSGVSKNIGPPLLSFRYWQACMGRLW